MDQRLAELSMTPDHGPLPDGTRSVESVIALIRGVFGFGGPVDMQASAIRAAELETNGSTPWFAVANTALGHASYAMGDLDTAVGVLSKAASGEATPALIRILALSTLSLAEAELGHYDRSRKFAEESMEVVESRSLHALPSVSMAFTALGRSQAANGDLAQAMATLEHGLNLRRKIAGLSPWPTLHHLLVMGQVAIMSGDLQLARQLLDEAPPLLRQFKDGIAPMMSRLEAVQKSLRERQNGNGHAEALTAREVEVLRRLTGSLSLGEIASELYLSPNTIKTHTASLYRKLGARSRSEAVNIGRERLLI
jgi:LuxR family transcriptional regulator, maltose regulon positive regulatory protein